jgi:hypothetical protein
VVKVEMAEEMGVLVALEVQELEINLDLTV